MLNKEKLKECMKKLERDEKRINLGKQREFYFSASYVEANDIVQYLLDQNKFARKKLEEEKQKCFDFSMDLKEQEKAGFFARKENAQKIAAWADKAYPRRMVELYEIQFEKEYVVSLMRKIN